VEKNPIQKTREALYHRLSNFDFTEQQLEDKSLFQLLNLVFALVGNVGYVGTFITTCRTMEEIFGEHEFYYRKEKPENLVREGHEPRPKMVVH
jgi:hypothetical protein